MSRKAEKIAMRVCALPVVLFTKAGGMGDVCNASLKNGVALLVTPTINNPGNRNGEGVKAKWAQKQFYCLL